MKNLATNILKILAIFLKNNFW